ncbi:MAG: phage holin family protein [Acidobacteriota bacterium]
MLRRALLRILINSLALYLAARWVSGIGFDGKWWELLLAGLVLSIFNMILRPILLLVTFPLLIITLGLFYFVVNGVILYLLPFFIPGFRVEGIVPAIIGALVISLVNLILNWLIRPKKQR